jgi:hypothetical protein
MDIRYKRARLLPVTAIAAFTFVLLLSCSDRKIEVPEGYTLVWNDEFKGRSLDESKWNAFLGGGGFGNRELQFYRPENLITYVSFKKEADNENLRCLLLPERELPLPCR